MRYGEFAIAHTKSLWQLSYSDGASFLDFGAGVRPGVRRERRQIIGRHSCGAVVNAAIAFEDFGTKGREGCAAATWTTRRGSHDEFGKRLVHAVEQEPRALVGHPHLARGGRDRTGIPNAFEQRSFTGADARAGTQKRC